MSLGEFMEKYIYYPIVLNRKVMKFSKKIPSKYLQKVFSATLASIIVFIVVGIWHGTGWNYVAYGCYQAFFVSTAVLLGPVYKKMRAVCRINEHGTGWKIITAVRTFLILTVGRYFIKAGNLAQAGLLMKKSLDLSNFHVIYDGTLLEHGLDYKNIYIMLAGIVILIAVDIMHGKGLELREILCRQDVFVRYLVYTAALFCIIMLGIYGLEFNSVSFIYQSF
jgi:D-alanyl-lipoteichoic acid acyltransferase DltB (MBOAT superfamily)